MKSCFRARRKRWIMQRAHRIALDPTNRQSTQLARAAGTARFAYNWALANWKSQYDASLDDVSLTKPSQHSLRKELNAIKRSKFPWMLESTKCAPQEAIIALGVAFKNYFDGHGRHPTFKRRGVHDSFRLSAGQFSINNARIWVPKIGWIRMREELRFENAKQVSVTVSRVADHWYASIACEVEDASPQKPTNSTVGVDVGVREYVISDGSRHTVPRSLRAKQATLHRAQRKLSRTKRGSKNRAKARLRVAKIHARVANSRSDWLHKLTTPLADHHDTIVIEDLNVRGMLQNNRLAMSITDASFGEFRRMLSYKTQSRMTKLVVADRWFPSSKLCSFCATKAKSLSLRQRKWTCASCGSKHDRDFNAAKNLAAYAPEQRREFRGDSLWSALGRCSARTQSEQSKSS